MQASASAVLRLGPSIVLVQWHSLWLQLAVS
jgi:hypothetical protein